MFDFKQKPTKISCVCCQECEVQALLIQQAVRGKGGQCEVKPQREEIAHNKPFLDRKGSTFAPR